MTQSNARAAAKLGIVTMGAALTMACSSDSDVPTGRGDNDAAPRGDAGQDALDDVFQDGSPEDVARTLEAMVDAGDAQLDDSPPTPIYKGVTFD